jgi:hypothetical protein
MKEILLSIVPGKRVNRMKRKQVIIIIMILALGLTLFLSGCGNSGSEAEPSDSETKSAEGGTLSEEAEAALLDLLSNTDYDMSSLEYMGQIDIGGNDCMEYKWVDGWYLYVKNSAPVVIYSAEGRNQGAFIVWENGETVQGEIEY